MASTQPTNWSSSFSSSLLTLNPGQTGSVTLTETVPAGTTPATYAISTSATNGSYAASASANLTAMAAPTMTASLSASASSYSTRQTISMTTHVLSGSTPVAGASVTFTITEANGSKTTKSAVTDSKGNAVCTYKLGPKDPKGSWSAVAQAAYSSQTVISNVATFTVQ